MTKSTKSKMCPLAERLEPRLLLSGELVGYQLVVADMSGTPVSVAEVGQDFQLLVYAQDQRVTPQGVFAGFLDVAYDQTKVHPVGNASYGSDYPNFHTGDTSTAGLLDEVGAIASLTPLGGGAKLLFSQEFHADAAGSFNFSGNSADNSPAHDTLIYGDDNPVTQISFGQASLQVNAAAPPTATLAAPSNGGAITDATINGRHWIAVTFADTGGSGLDPSTIDGDEISLGGAAASGATLDGTAELVPGTTSTYRYRFTGTFSSGLATVSLNEGSFADLAGNASVAAAGQGFTVTSGQVAYTLKLTDLSGSELPKDGSNYVLSAGDSFIAEAWVDDLRFAGSAGGVFAAFADLTYASDQIDWQTGTLVLGPDFPNFQSGTISEPSSLVDEAGGVAGLTPLGSDPARLLFKVTGTVKDQVGVNGFTLALDPTDSSPAHDTLIYGSDVPVPTAQISYDQLTVEIAPDLTPPTATLADPTNGGSPADTTLNGRHWIAMTFADTGGSGLDASTINGDEITLGGAGAAGVTLDGTATQVGSTNTYHYGFTGSFVPGAVTVHFVPGSLADAADNPNAAVADQGFTVVAGDATPPTADLADPANGASITSAMLNSRHYIAVTFADTGGSGLNAAAINGDEISLGGAAASGVTLSGSVTQEGSTNTYDYAFTGNFAAGTVMITLTAGTFADMSGNPNASVADQSFTVTDVTAPTASMAHPADGGTIAMATINSSERYIAVTFADTGGSGLNLSTITDAGAEFTLSGAAASGVTVNGAPTLVSGTTYRYSFTGDLGLGQVTVTFPAGGFADQAANPNAQATASFTVADLLSPTATLAHPASGKTISQTTINQTERYIDVTFADTGGSGLNLSTITDAGAEFTLSGAAASGVAVNGAATLVPGSGSTYRYSFTGNFGIGTVTVNYQAGSFADQAGNLIAAGAESFNALSVVPHIVITDDSGNAGDRLVALPTTALGAISSPQVFTLTNVGMRPLTVSSLKVAGNVFADFGVIVKSNTGAVVTAKTFTIPGGASYTVEVRLRPAWYSGTRPTWALITFKTNDGLNAPADKSVVLIMTGTVADSVGNTPATATALGTIGKKARTVTGYVGPGDADDYFTFTVAADPVKLASKVTLKLTNAIGDADLYLYAADGTTMLASSIKPGKATDSIVKSMFPGTYVLRVAAFASVLTRYTLSLTATT